MAVTLKDVAKKAGVSAATVSRVLQDHPRISTKTKEHVLKCVAELGYVINNVARSLKTNKSHIIGFICPELMNNFFMNVGKGLDKELKKNGYSLIICNSDESIEGEKSHLRLLMQQCVDGIIIIPSTSEGAHLQAILHDSIPTICIDRTFEDFTCDSVLVDNMNGSYQATEELIHKGFTRIAYIGGNKTLTTAKEREAGYRNALKDYNIHIDEKYIMEGDFHAESGHALMQKLMLMKKPPDTVFVANYFMYLGAMRYLLQDAAQRHKTGLPPLSAITMANFDNMEYLSVFGGSTVIVEQPMEQIGREAAKLLLKRLDGNTKGFPEQHRLKTKLIISSNN